jgi:hypothetical protein
MTTAAERTSVAGGAAPPRRPERLANPRLDMAQCQQARVCRVPYQCRAARGCYFVEAVAAHDRKEFARTW